MKCHLCYTQITGTFWNPFASLKKLDRLSKLCKQYSNWPFWIFLVHLVKSFAATRISHIVQNICPFLVYATTLLPALSNPCKLPRPQPNKPCFSSGVRGSSWKSKASFQARGKSCLAMFPLLFSQRFSYIEITCEKHQCF